MKYKFNVLELLQQIEVRTNYVKKVADGTAQASTEDVIKMLDEINYLKEKMEELVSLEATEN